jgi:hypothetical protein
VPVRASAALALAIFLILPGSAAGAVKTGLDRHAGMRLTLDGRVLTAKIANARGGDLDLEEQLYGKRIDAVCSSSFLRPRQHSVVRARRWPVGARRLSFRFGRDISDRVKWCLIEKHGVDVAAVTYILPEPIRFVGKGRGPSGTWWRLGAGTGVLGEPCVLWRTERTSARLCFSKFAERRVTLGLQQWLACDRDAYFFGVVSPTAAAVRLVLVDGTSVDADVYDRPRGSHLRARLFAAALPGGTDVRAAQSFDAAGALLAEGPAPELAGPECP